MASLSDIRRIEQLAKEIRESGEGGKLPGESDVQRVERLARSRRSGRSRPKPDYTAGAEAHREELRSQKFVVEPIIMKPKVTEPHIILPPQVDDYLWRQTEEDLPRQDIPILREPYKKAKKAIEEYRPKKHSLAWYIGQGVKAREKIIKEYDPKEFSVAWGIREAVKAEEKLFKGVTKELQSTHERAERQAEEAKLKGEDALAGWYYGLSKGMKGFEGLLTASSFFVRPKVILKTPRDVGALSDPKVQILALTEFAKDPLGGLVYAGGALIGGGIAGKAIGKLTHTKIPSESFYIEDAETRLMEYPRAVSETVTDYILEKTKVPKSGLGESPATLMERGEWPKGSGGTPVLLTEDPGFVEIMKPIPFIEVMEGHLPGMAKPTTPIILGPRSSHLGAVGLLGAVSKTPVEERILEEMKAKPSPGLELFDRPDFIPLDPGVREIIKPVSTTRQRERVDPGYVIPPAEIEKELERVLPGYTQRVGGRQKTETMEKEIQRTLAWIAPPGPRATFKEDPPFRFDFPLPKGSKHKRREIFEEMWGETRRYPVSPIMRYLRGFFVEDSENTKTRRKSERERKSAFKRLLGGLI